jgi:hypothetical protein
MKCSALGRHTLSLSFVFFGAYALASLQAAGYHLLKTVPLAAAPGGGEYFDYIETNTIAVPGSNWIASTPAVMENDWITFLLSASIIDTRGHDPRIPRRHTRQAQRGRDG